MSALIRIDPSLLASTPLIRGNVLGCDAVPTSIDDRSRVGVEIVKLLIEFVERQLRGEPLHEPRGVGRMILERGINDLASPLIHGDKVRPTPPTMVLPIVHFIHEACAA